MLVQKQQYEYILRVQRNMRSRQKKQQINTESQHSGENTRDDTKDCRYINAEHGRPDKYGFERYVGFLNN